MSPKTQIEQAHSKLCSHTLYSSIKDIEDIKIFMKWHVFAVWDFMSLLKSLQREITCIAVPWVPAKYDKNVVRFINEIVVGEESDEDFNGEHIDHFTMYLNAMKEIEADTSPIDNFLKTFSFDDIPQPVAQFSRFNLDLVTKNNPLHVASAFFYGRENLIPDLFSPLVKVLEEKNIKAPSFKHYLERHIELDGEEHGGLAGKMLEELCDSEKKSKEAVDIALKSLDLRSQLWDYVLEEIKSTKKAIKKLTKKSTEKATKKTTKKITRKVAKSA